MAQINIPDKVRDRLNVLAEKEKRLLLFKPTQGYLINKALDVMEGKK